MTGITQEYENIVDETVPEIQKEVLRGTETILAEFSELGCDVLAEPIGDLSDEFLTKYIKEVQKLKTEHDKFRLKD